VFGDSLLWHNPEVLVTPPFQRLVILRSIILSLLCLVTAALAAAQPKQLPVIQYYIEGTKARDAGDYAGYLELFVKASGEVPGHPILLIHTARAQTLLGQSDDAIGTLRLLARTGAYFDMAADTSLTGLHGSSEYADVEHLIGLNSKPVGTSRVTIEGGHPLLIPEGINYDSKNDVFFLSSISDRKVVKVDRDGNFTDFTTPIDDFYGGLGMQVDTGRRHLWVVTSMWPGVGGYREEVHGFSSISCFDLNLADPDDQHTLNDCALDSSGRLYITDTTTGALYLLGTGVDTLETIVPDGVLNGGNGLALDESMGLLYVSRWSLDVVVVDLRTREVHSLMQPGDVSLVGVDGLYLHETGLIAVQNHRTMNRIARFRLSEDGRRITSSEVLAGWQPNFEEPTAGVVVGDTFYFIGNSQIERFGDGKDKDPADFNPTQILELSL
jgi:sugar lactone lactonase YvrE